MKAIISLTINIFVLNLYALEKGASCEINGAVRCMCPASITVTCQNNGSETKTSGYMRNEENLQKALFVITNSSTFQKRNIWLSERDLKNITARDLYGVNYNQEIRKLVNAKDGEEVSTKYFILSSDTKLYEDANARTEKVEGSNQECSYVDELPNIIDSCGKQICIAKVQCSDFNGSKFKGTSACLAINGSCPSASACVDDQSVILKPEQQKSTLLKSSDTNFQTK